MAGPAEPSLSIRLENSGGVSLLKDSFNNMVACPVNLISAQYLHLHVHMDGTRAPLGNPFSRDCGGHDSDSGSDSGHAFSDYFQGDGDGSDRGDDGGNSPGGVPPLRRMNEPTDLEGAICDPTLPSGGSDPVLPPVPLPEDPATAETEDEHECPFNHVADSAASDVAPEKKKKKSNKISKDKKKNKTSKKKRNKNEEKWESSHSRRVAARD